MAPSVFFRRSEFPEGLIESVRQEYWIVTEPAEAARSISDLPFHYSLENSENLAAARERQHAPKSRMTLISLCANFHELGQ